MSVSVLVVQDYKENRKKCTLTPLIGRPEIEFLRLRHPARGPEKIEIGSGVLLTVDAPELKPEDLELLGGAGNLVVIDSTWARVSRVVDRVQLARDSRVERRSLPAGIQTAYPRVSKLYRDPAVGLASVEALFAATVVLGEPRIEWLSDYRWKDEFLCRNRWTSLASSQVTALRS